MKYIVAFVVFLVCFGCAFTGCTLDVAPPNIQIQCVEVALPGDIVTYCKDAGSDRG